MKTAKFVYWQEDGVWIGYLPDYPDYWTQGETFADLKEHRRDLHRDLSVGVVSGTRKVEDSSCRETTRSDSKDEPPWMAGFGALSDLADENRRVLAAIEAEFETEDP